MIIAQICEFLRLVAVFDDLLSINKFEIHYFYQALT
jgi:hypothetical protein